MALFWPARRFKPPRITLRFFLYIATFGSILNLLVFFSSTERAHRIVPDTLHTPVPSLAKAPKSTQDGSVNGHVPPPLPLDEEPDETGIFQQWKTAQSIDAHPIDNLITNARKTHLQTLKARSHNLDAAAKQYRKRRNRHPPPGFEKWVEYALQHDAVLVESFFDRVYHDLQPFWALDAERIAQSATNWNHVVRVRDGRALSIGDTAGLVPWLKLWTELVAECAQHLPDVDMPINYMDESRLVVPWTEIDRLVKVAQERQKVLPAEETVREYKKGVMRQNFSLPVADVDRPAWIEDLEPPIWDHVTAGCSPESPSHGVPGLKDFTGAPEFPAQDQEASYMENGYVKNVTAARDVCQQPHLRGLHSTVIEPVSVSMFKQLFPLFGGSKLLPNNEILIPGAMYLTDDAFYSGGTDHGAEWKSKTSTLSWRGVASGGHHSAKNWRHFHRLRLIEMLNGTTVSNIELHNGSAMTFEMPLANRYKSALNQPGRIGQWLSENADAGFIELLCWPRKTDCNYLSEYFQEVQHKSMSEQYTSKFLVDTDGNSFSARYRALLFSTSVPFKSTIYAEWHDDRLQPWLHYVPMDNTFQDIYGLLDYFTRDEKGDIAAQLIAETGKTWAESTLRRDDMLLYVWRVLLEFARICNDDRDKLGFVQDLVAGDKV